jgi:hypothetical protein
MKNLPVKNSSSCHRAQEAGELAFALKIRQHLNQGSEQLGQDISARLRSVRLGAAEQQKKEREMLLLIPASVYQCSEITYPTPMAWCKQSLAYLIAALLLVFALIGANQWQEAERIDELAEIDALILADALPINAHLDPGFIAKLQDNE